MFIVSYLFVLSSSISTFLLLLSIDATMEEEEK